MASRTQGRGGYTLLELALAGALLTLVLLKGSVVLRSVTRFSGREANLISLEDRAEDLLDRISYALMAANRQTLLPSVAAPLHSESIRYQVSMGVEDGEVVWAAPERIGVDPAVDNQLTWTKDPGAPEERSVVWTNLVRPLLEGEVLNGVDDNGNGLVDEKGISFDIQGSSVVIRLTLGDEDGAASSFERTVEAVVTCRNFVE